METGATGEAREPCCGVLEGNAQAPQVVGRAWSCRRLELDTVGRVPLLGS